MPPRALRLTPLLLAACLLPPTPSLAEAPNIAVFNFQMTSDTPEWAWLEKGLADQITTDLCQRGIVAVARDRMQQVAEEIAWAPRVCGGKAVGGLLPGKSGWDFRGFSGTMGDRIFLRGLGPPPAVGVFCLLALSGNRVPLF